MTEEQQPQAGLSPYDVAVRLREMIDNGSRYASRRKHRFQRFSSVVKLLSLGLSATSTVILGLQNLGFWAGLAFSLVAVVTVINAVEPFFNWRSRWVLMEETQARFYRLRDDLDYHLAKTPEGELTFAHVDVFHDRYRNIWDDLSRRWLEYRRREPAGAGY